MKVLVTWTVVTVVVVLVATVVVRVTVEAVARQEHALEVAAGEEALRQAGALVAARLSLLFDGGVQVLTVEVMVWVPAMNVEVDVLGGRWISTGAWG